ncbi:hypothetical protein D1872_248400 [compost metagenome]
MHQCVCRSVAVTLQCRQFERFPISQPLCKPFSHHPLECRTAAVVEMKIGDDFTPYFETAGIVAVADQNIFKRQRSAIELPTALLQHFPNPRIFGHLCE